MENMDLIRGALTKALEMMEGTLVVLEGVEDEANAAWGPKSEYWETIRRLDDAVDACKRAISSTNVDG